MLEGNLHGMPVSLGVGGVTGHNDQSLEVRLATPSLHRSSPQLVSEEADFGKQQSQEEEGRESCKMEYLYMTGESLSKIVATMTQLTFCQRGFSA